MKIKNISLFILLLVLSCSGSTFEFSEVTVKGGALPEFNRTGKDLAIGAFAPIPTGVDLYGNPITMTTRVGLEERKASVIVFLAHWCSHCQREVPMIQNWINKNGSSDNINLFSVATYIEKNKPNYPPNDWLIREQWSSSVIFDNEENIIAEHFGLNAFPYWVFLNSDGTVNMRHSGSLGEDKFNQIMNAGLNESIN
ncbi:MAG: redoxin domain-containing protein [Dehalococcoidales bacterium]|jgi:cytochrome c biogenesis protein CcmG, thiol:disulfide interchange protein DsbE|nr:redoxin domain-containing protein [Dehalococcoidales bacterium]|tara:strand:- start:8087 stop:8677 length:591 start_codon:yes stop_codon:yes gene_type:complete